MNNMAKFAKMFQKMTEDNSYLFEEFKTIHDKFVQSPKEHETLFHEKGQKILRIIRQYENALCAKSENSGYKNFSTNLSEKFWEEVRAYLPKIDEVKLL